MKKERKAGELLSQLMLGYSFLSLLLSEFFYVILKKSNEVNGISHYAVNSVNSVGTVKVQEFQMMTLLLFVAALVIGVGVISVLITYEIFKKREGVFIKSLIDLDSSGLKSIALIVFFILPIYGVLNILFWGLNMSIISIMVSSSVLVLVHSLGLWFIVRRDKPIETMSI